MRRGAVYHNRSLNFVLACLALAAALVSGPFNEAKAEDTGGSHPVDSVLKFLNLKTDPGSFPDFVEASRPKAGTTAFVPTGILHPNRPKVMSAKDIKASEAELDTARERHDKIAGRKPPVESVPGKAADAKNKKTPLPATPN